MPVYDIVLVSKFVIACLLLALFCSFICCGIVVLSYCYSLTYQRNELTRNSSGNTRPQSSQLAELLWTDPGVKSGICARADPHFIFFFF